MWGYMGQCKTLVCTLSEMEEPLEEMGQKSLWMLSQIRLQGSLGRSPETCQETIAVFQAREDGGSRQCGSCGRREKLF